MRIKIRHQTRYKYEQPARDALQLMRMTPRSSDSQFVRSWRVEINADARLDKGEDAYGNITHIVSIAGPINEVVIAIEGEVETTDLAGVIRGTTEWHPPQMYLRETSLTAPSAAISELAIKSKASQNDDVIATLHDIASKIHTRIRLDPDEANLRTTAADAFKAGHGDSRDCAQIFCAAARSIGIPARFVNGYFLRTNEPDQGAGHAWAEAYVAGFGWIGFDASEDQCITDRYVRVAIGADAQEAAVLRGSQTGGEGEKLEVTVEVRPGREILPHQTMSQQQSSNQQ